MFTAARKQELDSQTKTVTLLICFLPLIRYYIPGLAPIMFSDVAQLYLVYIGINRKNEKNYSSHLPLSNALLLYGAYVVFATALSDFYMPVFDYATNITTIIRLWIYILIICFTLDPFFDKEYGFQTALKIGFVNSCLTTVQLILHLVFKIRTSFLIPFLNAEAGYSNERVYAQREFRPTGLFYEPAQSVYYNLPLILILLYSAFNDQKMDENTKTMNTIYAIILTIGVMCTESGAGAVIVIAIWVVYIFMNLVKSNNKKGIMLFLFFSAAVPIVSRLDFFAKAFNRGTNINKGSGSTRILRGFMTWIQFPNEFKIFGIGYANYDIYVKNSNFFTIYDAVQDVGWTNAATQILSGLGIFGAVILLTFYYRTYTCCKKDLPSALLIIYLFFSMFYSGIFLGVYFIIFMAYILSRTKAENNEISV